MIGLIRGIYGLNLSRRGTSASIRSAEWVKIMPSVESVTATPKANVSERNIACDKEPTFVAERETANALGQGTSPIRKPITGTCFDKVLVCFSVQEHEQH